MVLKIVQETTINTVNYSYIKRKRRRMLKKLQSFSLMIAKVLQAQSILFEKEESFTEIKTKVFKKNYLKTHSRYPFINLILI